MVPIANSLYRVKSESICIADVNYRLQTLLDNQQFADPNDEALNLGISSAQWSLFGQVWPMSRILARIMASERLEDRRILELGCGIGLPSLVVQKRGGCITASDYHPLASSFLTTNTRLNLLHPIPFGVGNWNVELLNWGKFDLIIGSDILYEHQHIQSIVSLIETLSHRSTRVLIVDPGRGFHRQFATAMQHIGFTHTWSDLHEFAIQSNFLKGFVFRFAQN